MVMQWARITRPVYDDMFLVSCCSILANNCHKKVREGVKNIQRGSMGKLEELSKFLEYPSNMLENTSQLIWNIPVTYWKFSVGSKMILVFFGIIMTYKNSIN